jgi:hypothetical protein
MIEDSAPRIQANAQAAMIGPSGGGLIEFDSNAGFFTESGGERAEDYITGRFG